ncbi:YncE family protein [Lacunimicrobium album]
MMANRVVCTACGYAANVKGNIEGRKIKCPKCQASMKVLDELEFIDNAPPLKTSNSQITISPIMAAVGGAGGMLVLILVFFIGMQFAKPSVPSDTAKSPTSPPVESTSTVTQTHVASRQAETTPPPAESTPIVSPQQSVITQPDKKNSFTRITPPSNSRPSIPNRPNQNMTPPSGKPKPEEVPTLDTPKLDSVDFAVLPMDNPATFITLTEDHQTLVISHEADGIVTFYDIATGKQSVARTKSPRSILSRDNKVFVANVSEGTISVFSNGPNWKMTNLLDVKKPGIAHMAAASGKAFNDMIIVTCHGPGKQASYQDAYTIVLNTQTDRIKQIGKYALANVSHDGRIALTQESFNLSPSGGMTGYSFADFLNGDPKAVFRGGHSQTGYVYQPHPGSFWISNNIVYGGSPPTQIGAETKKRFDAGLTNLIIPDMSQKLVYKLSENSISAHRLATGLPEVGSRRAKFATGYSKKIDETYMLPYRFRDYILDHPIAITQGDSLRFFLLTREGGEILTAHTSPLSSVSSLLNTPSISRAMSSNSPTPTSTETGPEEMNGLFRDFPALTAVGKSLRHKLVVPEGTVVEILSPPNGFALSKSFEIQWAPTAEQVGVHQLKFRVQQNGSTEFIRPNVEVISKELAATVKGDLSKLNEFAFLPLVIDHYSLEPGLNDSLLLLQGDSLKRLGSDGLTVIEELTLPKRYAFLRERPNTFIAVANAPTPVLDVIDKTSMAVIKSIDMTTTQTRVLEITDLAIHPADNKSYIGIKHDNELPRYSVLAVDEQTSTVTSPGIIGKWVTLSPDGRTLYTGYSDIYQQGTNYHINPDWRLIEIPDYGNIDMILSWNLGTAVTLNKVVRKAGGNGNGIRMSSDGQRISYLSHVGTPEFSKNLVGFSTSNLSTSGVNYETKDKAVTTELAYHPFLPWVAVPGSGSAILFDRETGTPINSKLLIASRGMGDTKVERMLFSPDGQSLVFICSDADRGQYIRTIRLSVTDEDMKRKLPPPPRPTSNDNAPVVMR